MPVIQILSFKSDFILLICDFLTLVGALSDGKDVRPALGPPLAHVQLHGAEGVDGEPLVRVDGDTEEAGVGVDQLVLVPDQKIR